MRPTPLCVAFPVLGQKSETFVKKHAEEVLPGQTSALVSFALPPSERAWEFSGPTLVLDPTWRPLRGAIKVLRSTVSRKSTERRIVEFLKRQQVNAIVVEYLDKMLEFAEPIMKAGIRWYSFGHGYDVSERLLHASWRERYKVHNSVNGVFVRAYCLRERLIQSGFRADNVHVVRGGVDVPAECPLLSQRDQIRLLVVGRMVPKKGPLLTLRAFSIASQLIPNLRLAYIGDGPLFEDAKSFVEDHNLGGKVELLGGQPSAVVMQRLKESDIFVQHSIKDPVSGDEEGLPAAITEAMAHALPVVSTYHAGIPEAVLDGKTGFLVPEGDVEGMASRIACLAESFEMRREFGRAGWTWALEEFSWQGERDRILSLTGLSKGGES